MPPPRVPSPEERYALAVKHAALTRNLILHPSTAFRGDKITDPANTPPILAYVTDFQMTTYRKPLIPVLPPDATQTCRALAYPWNYTDPDFMENMDMLKPEHYPSMEDEDLMEKWTDARMRGPFCAILILDKEKQEIFDGPFDFGEDVENAARALMAH
ncbi:MAG: hypothetical protein Q9160_004107 [Pyrenula sp. 1 TL-2023]